MTLTLKIRGLDRLDNGMPAEFVLNRRGAVIGRAATCDWSLPDPRHYISSRHLEIGFRDGAYSASDVSTNGTFLNGAGDRMAGPRRVEPGDRFTVGQYEIVAELTGEAAVAIERREEEQAAQAQKEASWSWDQHGGAAPPTPSPPDRGGGWDGGNPNGGLSSGFAGSAAPLDGGGWGDAPAGSGGDGGGWGAPATAGSGDGWGPTPSDAGSSSSSWGPAPSAPPPQPAVAGWAPAAPGPSLNREAPYAQRGAAPIPASGDPLGGANSWAPASSAPPPPPPSPSVWDGAREPVQQASAWSSQVSDRPREATPNDIWGSMEGANVVDWARADFGGVAKRNDDPLGLAPAPAAAALPRELPSAPAASASVETGWAPSTAEAPPVDGGWSERSAPAPSSALDERSRASGAPTAAAPAQVVAPPPPPAPASAPDLRQVLARIATAAGLAPDQLKQAEPATLDRIGQALRGLVSGLVVMVEARARAKSQMGAEQTGLEFDGNNPLKFARTPDQALAQLINPTERGFMAAERAIEDAYFDLQSHQMATLKAMQGALRATLDRFSPAAIRKRAETGGFMSRLLPGGREATLWATYEREFSGVAQGSDEAFMDVFAKEFRTAYEAQARNRKKG